MSEPEVEEKNAIRTFFSSLKLKLFREQKIEQDSLFSKIRLAFNRDTKTIEIVRYRKKTKARDPSYKQIQRFEPVTIAT